ncbi:hypothetical protein Sgleb_11560 [Streptomyces glebosus]|uniref:DUF2867 domain-containing protein n=1 Tax=Streptomyces glebosus TaxID=249580 RepID=A0A640SNY8_9ACTN|nr:DUF2867 domain-containing protein [Streptomyces glebosus]GFE13109.1 hypothetical protein Sgleb_11560 [Streptomyces glebosus]GHG78277.1 hypothetical protein GCM10010513_54510 [Streptomyces glebosus]
MRTVRDVHARTVHAPAAAVGALLDRLGGADDPLFPTPVWPPMRFDRPLGVGADGGHGFIRYRVTAYEPGLRIRFDFTGGEDGWHEITVRPLGPDSCRVEHVLESRPRPARAVLWSLALRAVHDTVVEEIFDNIERAATGRVTAPVRRSPRVRLFNRLLWDRPRAVELPAAARLAHRAFPRTDFQDAWQMDLLPGMPQEPEAWEGVLRGASFPVAGRTDTEILLGEDARHLDFRASVLVEDGRVTLGTVVRLHRTAGRLYFAVVRRIHPFMARLMLRRIHRRLALAAPTAGERAAARG